MLVAETVPNLPPGLPWQVQEFGSVAELASAAIGTLADKPVLIMPSWEEFAPRQIRRSDSESPLLSIQPASPDALIAMIVPAAALTSHGQRELRESLLSRWNPLALVYGANFLPGIHRSTVLSLAFLGGRNGPLRLFRIPDNTPDDEVCADFHRLMDKPGGKTKFGYVLDDLPEPGDSLAFDRHDPELLSRKADLAGYGFTVRVGELFELHRGRLHLAADRELLGDAGRRGAIRVIDGRHLQRDGWISPPDNRSMWAVVPDDRRIRAGDILLRTIYHPTDRQGLVVVEATEHDLPAVASHKVIVLRARAKLDAIQRLFILQFLRLPLAHLLANAAGGEGLQLSMQALRELQLPQPDKELRAAVVDLIDVADQFRAWQENADDLLDSVVLDDTAKAARTRIVDVGRLLRQRAEAASALDDHGYIVRTRFPYPIALRWRHVEAAVSAGPSASSYRAILEAAEVLLCYAANLVLILAHQWGSPIRYANNLRARLTSGQGGPGFGDWVAVLEELRTSRAYRTLPDTHPLTGLRGLLASPEANAARRRLAERRNDQAHLRSVDDVELPTAISASVEDLRKLLRAADFLPDIPLVHVTGVRWDALRQQAVVSYQELSGDHPVVPTKSMSYDASDIEIGSLYLLDDQRRLHLLRPMLTGRICPVCRNWSTFHIDRCSQNGVELKSLEHGHTVSDETLRQPFAHVGLL